jgi:ABC-type dipeptide/oligopeptide/nickel transport system permease subunit
MHSTRGLDKRFLFPLILVGIGISFLILGSILPSPYTQNPSHRFMPVHLPITLGTDYLGRELSSRLFFGFLNTLQFVSLTLLSTILVALPMGLIAARYPRIESIVDTIAGAIWSFPTLIIGLIVFVGFKGEWISIKFFLLGLFNWVPLYKAIRDNTKQLQFAEHVVCARSFGFSEFHVFAFDVFPILISTIIPIILLNLVSLFEAEFALSFLGLSYPDPIPTLGAILRQGISYLNMTMILLPTFLLMIIIFCILTIYQLEKRQY